jgi:hypothetical protein
VRAHTITIKKSKGWGASKHRAGDFFAKVIGTAGGKKYAFECYPDDGSKEGALLMAREWIAEKEVSA